MTQVSTLTVCARHPTVETALRCQQCDTLICPRCMVQSPVGAKCPDCARVRKSPIYTLSPLLFARGLAAAVLGGAAMGAIWVLVLLPFTVGFFSIFIGAGLGYVFTRLMDFATRRKRGIYPISLAILGIAIAWGITVPFFGGQLALYGLVAAGLGVYFAYSNLR